MTKKFRKRPVVIEAVQWTGENLREVIDFTGWNKSASNQWTWEEYTQIVQREGLKIFTLEGSMMASIGDWIIKGVHGEFYPCKPDIFEKTYEQITEMIPDAEINRQVMVLFEQSKGLPFRIKATPLTDIVDGVDWKNMTVKGRKYGDFGVHLCELIGGDEQPIQN